MLNSIFAFGVPIFLFILYSGFAIFRKKSDIPYLGFVLFIIAGFLIAFSLQVIQQGLTEMALASQTELETTYGYPFYLLAIPLAIGILLLILNTYRGYRRAKQFYESK